jgi:hypothetical protein
MKKLIIISLSAFLIACENNKKADMSADNAAPPEQTAGTATATGSPPVSTDSYVNTTVMVEGKEIKISSSILVDIDKKKLKSGAPYRAMITTSSSPNNEGLILRFVFDTKAGTYPLTGMSFNRGTDDNVEQYGGLFGGEEKILGSTITLTECKDLGDNGAGGHKWSISGIVENLTIPAMESMLLDKEKNHPKEIKLDKISFTGLTFDDNAEEILQKAMGQLKDMK